MIIRKLKEKKQGFTLIELLIVVAIIAILAAIAVPNFMEAQMRAKIARVKSDMRSVATAIESYAVDHNKHPYGPKQMKEEVGMLGYTDDFTFRAHLWSRMTTPVAYMTTIPVDPFFEHGFIDHTGTKVWGQNFCQYHSLYPSPTKKATQAAYGKGFTWTLMSFGPLSDYDAADDLVTGAGMGHNTIAKGVVNGVYDSTNGTKSAGVIIRTNKGMYPNGN